MPDHSGILPRPPPPRSLAEPHVRRRRLFTRSVFLLAGAFTTIASFVLASNLVRHGGWETAANLVLVLPVCVTVGYIVYGTLKRRSVPWVSYLLGAALPWVLALGLYTISTPEPWLRTRSFDAERWREAAATREAWFEPTRVAMVDDLIESHLLEGLDRDAILDLLGPDDDEDGTGYRPGWYQAWDLYYCLGNHRVAMGMDDEWLLIGLDNGRVAEVRLHTD